MTDYLDKLAAQREIGERISVFAESLHAEESPELRILERKALEEGIPIIRPHTRGLIQCLLEMLAPRRILEIGTAVGYSALVMHTYAPAPCEIITIERDEKRAAQARLNFDRFGAENITLLEGDAAQILPGLEGTFDLIFMDAAKGQYIRFLPEVIRLLRVGGVLLSDNVLKRMREYLTAISEDPGLRTVLLETGDGAALSVRRRSAERAQQTKRKEAETSEEPSGQCAEAPGNEG